ENMRVHPVKKCETGTQGPRPVLAPRDSPWSRRTLDVFGRSGIGSTATNPDRKMPRHPGREIPIPHSRQPARSPVLGQPAPAHRPEEPPDMFERAKTRWLDTQRPRSVSPWTARLVTCMVLGFNGVAPAQTISREQMVFLTAEWKGERFPDGRPM